MNNLNLSDLKKNALLQMAGKQLGTDPNKLREQLETGNVSDIVDGLDAQQREKLNGFLNNPKALQALLGNTQVQDLLKNLSGQK